ncbi:MAG: hypothetical protein HQ462_01140 [Deltaproteobacteria bacterium]|nr:hypothetical protein [Deltaproteobacteria bacterium]
MRYFMIILSLLVVVSGQATAGLIIHAAEIGIGKFHRQDNIVHPYESGNAWLPYVLPTNAETKTPIVMENADHSITVFFSTLEELLTKVAQISQTRGEQISVLNFNAHGLPGGMWFPMNESFKNSVECWQWNAAATGSDKANHDQYYTPVAKQDIMSIREYAQTGGGVPCVTGYNQWKSILAKVPQLKPTLAKDLKLNILSCVVGLGPVGDKFMTGLGALLGGTDQVQLRSSLYFGLGDWSMPEGMGFWDYQTDEQLEHDNSIYGVNRKDREIMQKGKVRVTALVKGAWLSTVLEGQDFMSLGADSLEVSNATWGRELVSRSAIKPNTIRNPGTSVYESVK